MAQAADVWSGTEVRALAGVGFTCRLSTRWIPPGLGTRQARLNVDIDRDGSVVGLYWGGEGYCGAFLLLASS